MVFMGDELWTDVADVYDCTETWGYPFGENE
jgi:hypothetical protein